jgi:hypothetical protein
MLDRQQCAIPLRVVVGAVLALCAACQGGQAGREAPRAAAPSDRQIVSPGFRTHLYRAGTLQAELGVGEVRIERLSDDLFKLKTAKTLLIRDLEIGLFEQSEATGQIRSADAGLAAGDLLRGSVELLRPPPTGHGAGAWEVYRTFIRGVDLTLQRLDGRTIRIRAERAEYSADRHRLILAGDIAVDPPFEPPGAVFEIEWPLAADPDREALVLFKYRDLANRVRRKADHVFLYHTYASAQSKEIE